MPELFIERCARDKIASLANTRAHHAAQRVMNTIWHASCGSPPIECCLRKLCTGYDKESDHANATQNDRARADGAVGCRRGFRAGPATSAGAADGHATH